ncbi:MAG: 5'/3'-nucleotidase SurE [Alphaproteobacteria bacterium]|nr:5'/3'-nucleotidase SurE [Alphaproteobacteria bacterium]
MSPSPNLKNQRLLLVNDDGIHAPGMEILERIARELCDDVWVVAPEFEQSGASHSLSIANPIRVRQVDEKRFAIRGTPTDCALMAHYELMREKKPTILLSGINRGANLAEDVTYSGTCAAAMEGTQLGMRSVALSLVFTIGGKPYWATAERYAKRVIEHLLTVEWRQNAFINVNFPDCEPAEVTGIRLTRQGQRPPGSFTLDGRIDARNVPYYWVKISYNKGGELAETDLEAIDRNAISVTPLQLDLTHHGWREGLASSIAKLHIY